MQIPLEGADDHEWLRTTLAGSAGWPYRTVDTITTTRIGADYGLNGRSVRAAVRAGHREVTIVVKHDAARLVRRELLFYDRFSAPVRSWVPACLGGGADDDTDTGVLFLEDVSPAEQLDVLGGCTDDQAHALVGVLAHLHAATWTRDDTSFDAELPRWAASPMTAAHWAERVSVAAERFAEVLSGDMVARLQSVPDEVAACVERLRRGPSAWCHGDPHLDNVLWRDDGIVLLDWATSAVGPPTLDLARCLTGGLVHGPDAPLTSHLIDAYCATLGTLGIRLEATSLAAELGEAVLPVVQGTVGWAGSPGLLTGRMTSVCERQLRDTYAWLDQNRAG